MDNATEPTNALANADEPSLVTKAVKALVYPVSVVFGYIMAHRELHHATVNKLKKIINPDTGKPAVFEDIRDEMEQVHTRNALNRAENVIPKAEVLQNEIAANIQHSAKMAERLKREGFGTRENIFDFKAISNKWKFVNSTEKHKVILEGITITGVALGVLLTITGNKWLSDQFNKSDEHGRN
jgi:hypothetical protein